MQVSAMESHGHVNSHINTGVKVALHPRWTKHIKGPTPTPPHLTHTFINQWEGAAEPGETDAEMGKTCSNPSSQKLTRSWDGKAICCATIINTFFWTLEILSTALFIVDFLSLPGRGTVTSVIGESWLNWLKEFHIMHNSIALHKSRLWSHWGECSQNKPALLFSKTNN